LHRFATFFLKEKTMCYNILQSYALSILYAS
jgi:hypothetical protein